MFGIPKLYLIGAAVAAAVAAAVFIRWDAIQDERLRVAAEAAQARIETLQDATERRDAIENLGDDDLRRALCERLRANSPTGDVQGCSPSTAADETGDD